MGSGARSALRIPVILLALVNLALLGMRLWPWADVVNLPGNGATGIDPAVILVGYIGLVFWIAGHSNEPFQKALQGGLVLGLLAGIILVAEVLFRAHATAPEDSIQAGLLPKVSMALAAILWGITGLRGARMAKNASLGMIAGVWSAMVSGLMATTAVLAILYFAGPPPASQDPWKQYEGLAIGNAATQALVHSLNSASFFLLICPLLGAAVGILFAYAGYSPKD